ncbi:MAG: NusG domain II-containing protein [Elusimicrobiota bacterium]
MKTDKIHIFSKYDLIIIAAVLAVAIVFPFVAGSVHSEPARVLIYHNEELVESLEYGKPGKIEIDLETGPFIVIVEKEGVKVLESPCRHKICVRTHPITRAGECIVCAPNGMLVKIEGTDNRYHAISR